VGRSPIGEVCSVVGIKSPTGRYSNVLLAIDFKGGGNTDHTGGCREGPKLISRARIERPELPARGSVASALTMLSLTFIRVSADTPDRLAIAFNRRSVPTVIDL
jgi:hypothetical protein